MIKPNEKKYAETLGLMLKDALDAKNEAAENLAATREQQKIAESELKNLNETVKKRHCGFLRVIKDLLILLFKKPNIPFEIERALEPANSCLQALKAIPKAEAELACARDEHSKAQKAYLEAKNTIKLIENLIEKYPQDLHEDE